MRRNGEDRRVEQVCNRAMPLSRCTHPYTQCVVLCACWLCKSPCSLCVFRSTTDATGLLTRGWDAGMQLPRQTILAPPLCNTRPACCMLQHSLWFLEGDMAFVNTQQSQLVHMQHGSGWLHCFCFVVVDVIHRCQM